MHDAVRCWSGGRRSKEGKLRLFDQRKRCKDILLTTLVRGRAVDPMQRARYQSIAMATDVPMRQGHWRDVREKAWAKNQGNKTTHNTPGLIAYITRCLQKMEATLRDACTIGLRDTNILSLIK